MEKQLRKVQLKDKKQLNEICDKCFPNQDVFLIVDPLYKSEHFYIVEKQEKYEILGFMIFSVDSKNTVHLMIFAVSPVYQRQGIGSFMLEKAEQIIQKTNATIVHLEVQTDNKSAINFYEKHGYEIVKTIERYYEDGSDAFLMLKEIKE